MTIINSKEFATNQKKYFDMAINEDVLIKRGKNKFHLATITDNIQSKERVYYEPDEDFYNSITMDELREGVFKFIDELDKKYANK
jgi:predicted transcriptional regulator